MSEVALANAAALPRDTNTHGDIFGGWLMSQMDLAGGVSAGGWQWGSGNYRSKRNAVLKPVKVGK